MEVVLAKTSAGVAEVVEGRVTNADGAERIEAVVLGENTDAMVRLGVTRGRGETLERAGERDEADQAAPLLLCGSSLSQSCQPIPNLRSRIARILVSGLRSPENQRLTAEGSALQTLATLAAPPRSGWISRSLLAPALSLVNSGTALAIMSGAT